MCHLGKEAHVKILAQKGEEIMIEHVDIIVMLMLGEGPDCPELMHGALTTIGIIPLKQSSRGESTFLPSNPTHGEQSMSIIRGYHINGRHPFHSKRSFHNCRGLQSAGPHARIPAATNRNQYLEDPENWWNKVDEKDKDDLRIFRKAGCGGMPIELLDQLCNEWVHKRRRVMIFGTTAGEVVEVRPMWVGVNQASYGSEAQFFVSILPIMEESLAERILERKPQATVGGLTFKECDCQFENWHNFFVGIRGSIAGLEEHVYWPNWLYHDSRTRVNCRSWEDIALFLADATEEGIMSHLEKTKQLQQDRGYHEGWCYHRMKDRWGQEPLVKYNIDV